MIKIISGVFYFLLSKSVFSYMIYVDFCEKEEIIHKSI